MTSLLAMLHPGHGTTDPDSWRHYLTEPVHVLTLAAAVVAFAVTWFAYRRLRAPRPRVRRSD